VMLASGIAVSYFPLETSGRKLSDHVAAAWKLIKAFFSDFGGIRYTIQNQGQGAIRWFVQFLVEDTVGKKVQRRHQIVTLLYYCFSIEMYNCYMFFVLSKWHYY
jgi:hypothetical protein